MCMGYKVREDVVREGIEMGFIVNFMSRIQNY